MISTVFGAFLFSTNFPAKYAKIRPKMPER